MFNTKTESSGAPKLVLVRMCDMEPPLPRPKKPATLTLAEIIEIEPRIAQVLDAQKPLRRGHKRFFYYSEMKRQLSNLVGWSADQYILRTSQAYDVVMGVVIEKLNL